MKITGPDIIDWIYRQDLPWDKGDLHVFENLLIDGYKALKEDSQDLAARYAKTNINRLWNILKQRSQKETNNGITPLIDTFIDQDFRFISNYDTKSKQDITARKKIRCRPAILREIDSLNDREYEALACSILKNLGATHIRLNEGGNEGGVDFYAILKVHTRNHMFSNIGGSLRIIGQSKKYKTSVQDSTIKEFCQTINDIKQLTPSIKDKIPSWFLLSKSPIIGWIISHNGFQRGALDRAKNHGIMASDSLDLAEIIVMSKLKSYAETTNPSLKIEAIRNEKNNFLNFREFLAQ
ncbi:restriction endonuclease (plasmid) [Chromobacterium amazonense]|uniref:restriction endonuclease n=1 Tax=Chromobacterium amazonense TaxID=1382803 RepID=UPI00237D96B4|nr:restriction endonuclease [Chromobacterium amazonense]MDE1712009.1 restriction endonuclease [Chromobacterium amazonense]